MTNSSSRCTETEGDRLTSGAGEEVEAQMRSGDEKPTAWRAHWRWWLAGLLMVGGLFVWSRLPSAAERALLGHWRVSRSGGEPTHDLYFPNRRVIAVRSAAGRYQSDPAEWWIENGELYLREPMTFTDWIDVVWRRDWQSLNGYSEGTVHFASADELTIGTDPASRVRLVRIDESTPPLPKPVESEGTSP